MKIDLELHGMTFRIDAVVDDRKSTPVIIINRVLGAKLIRMFIKQTFGKKYKSWVKSESYANGSSIRAYICKLNGEPINPSDFTKLQIFTNLIQGADFDGMTDSTNYRKPLVTFRGTKLSMYTSYTFAYNKPYPGYQPKLK